MARTWTVWYTTFSLYAWFSQGSGQPNLHCIMRMGFPLGLDSRGYCQTKWSVSGMQWDLHQRHVLRMSPPVFASFCRAPEGCGHQGSSMTSFSWNIFRASCTCMESYTASSFDDLMSAASLLSLPTNSRRSCSWSNSRTFCKLASRLHQR